MSLFTRAAPAVAGLSLMATLALAQNATPAGTTGQAMPMQNMPMQAMPMQHGAMPMDHAAPAVSSDASASTQAFEAANARMHEGMAIAFTGNADVDFARGMIPHHQGAIDMARIELQYGTDPELRKLAQAIIAAQESEIAFLQAWVAKNAR